ncbi:glutathione S-transferase family protein [Pseudomonas sp. BN415]|uniref:glutathione S-transferase family protein n=1 Tax=Pseudomonas sp. BN415 TaxID=2567889 RepID=UPI0024584B26|nr:glutathione S-transferase family protein [Pseudomonas sp. BN415]MDH4581190.1 glutathione S-transferase family protein [Pseudomonas sp. BN415]
MEPVLFYGVPQGCSFGSIVALEWLGLPYRLCRVEMLEQPWDPLFAHINPLNKTPALLPENGQGFGESLAILLHLAGRAPGSELCPPQGSPEYDRLNQMLAYLVTDFFGSFAPLWAAYEMADGSDSTKAVLRKKGTEDVRVQCAYLDRLLQGQDWLLGEHRSLADAYFAGVSRWVEYMKLFDLGQAFPHLQRYLLKLKADPAITFARAIEDGEPAISCGGFKGHVTLAELAARLAA